MKRIAKFALGLALILGTVAYAYREPIRLWWLSRQIDLQKDNLRVVQELAEYDVAAFPVLLDLLKHDQSDLSDSVARSLSQRCDSWPEKSPNFDSLGEAILMHHRHFSITGHIATFGLLPKILRSCSPAMVEAFRPVVIGWLSHTDQVIRSRAIVLAQRDDLHALESVLPLLNDPAVEVRRAAMLAVGPAPIEGEPLIETEKLLPWLHDPDLGVQRNCEIALATRGLSAVEIRLSRQITDRNPLERLKLLVDLPRDDQFRIDPWLDRLSRDRDSAVRVGAARIALERGLDFEERLLEMLQNDPDQSVRKILEHYRTRSPK